MNVKNALLPDGQYFASAVKKTLIVLHHTVGGSAMSTRDWWITDPRRVGTAFIIERDGTVWRVFNEEYWAHHVACGDTDIETRSIGIELCSEGGLTEKGGVLFAFDGKKRLYDLQADRGRYYDHGSLWRGQFRYFDVYDEPQMAALIELVNQLCTKFDIPRAVPKNLYDADVRAYVKWKGILGHHHVRKDKTDLHPGFNWLKFLTGINGLAI